MYDKICSYENLLLAFYNSKKGKTKRRYIKRFQKHLKENLIKLQRELLNQTYKPYELQLFVLRDPKQEKSLNRLTETELCIMLYVIVPDFDKGFIYDSHANRIREGTLKATERFDKFKRIGSRNNTRECFVLKADIKHYFEEVGHQILINIIRKKIKDERVIWFIERILAVNKKIKGMPLN